MLKKILFLSTFASLLLTAQEKDIAGRSWDKLSYDGKTLTAEELARPLSRKELLRRADKQLTLCMIGDSVTWAQAGDYFRKELLLLIPDLAFEGTHTAALGYSHAGEGGDSSYGVLKRLNDKNRIPDAPYYHLLIGVNDASAAKVDSKSPAVAAAAVERIARIVNGLLARPTTRKVFLGSILPSPFGKNGESTVRERTGSLINAMLRKDLKKLFPNGNVVWIEYEKPLRQELATWKKRENLIGAHPTAKGYKWIAGIAAPVMKKHMVPEKSSAEGAVGVKVVNLWQKKQSESLPLIPGWYTLSMTPEKTGKITFTLYSVTQKVKSQFKKSYTINAQAGKRITVNFMTGYQNYGYTLAPFKLEFTQGAATDIMIEKTRPLQKASRYGEGTFVDSVSPVAPGERLVRAL